MTSLGDLAAAWPQLNALLDEALALPPPQRQDWLASLPAEHAPLKDTLARLLEVKGGIETGDFLRTLPRLDGAPGMPRPADIGTPQPGDAVGPWRLLRELGAGGMGSVWLAERADGQLKRQVALKLPRLSWARGLAERMARERDILATLEHPNIARLYDAGVDPLGRPWLALEYVQGRPIDAFARDQELTVRQHVQLLLQVCEAVAYAHSRLVIHRDLKPGNILVTDDGQVKLLDFGIAKLMQGERAEATALTEMAGRAYTPRYASPEQVKGQPLGTASDVYSLGIVAYELLTGALPYRLERESAAELERAIESGEPVPANQRAARPAYREALRGDLDAVLAMTLKKEAAERYRSVEALAQDLRRWLAGETVAAQPDSLAYRLRKLVARRRLETGIAAGLMVALAAGQFAQVAVAVALAVGTGLALWQRRLAQARQAEAERARQQALDAAQAERAAAADAAGQAARAEGVKAFAISLFEAADAERGAGVDTTALQLLQQAQARIEGELLDQPEVAFELKVALASSRASLGDRAGARELLAQLLEPASVSRPATAARVRARLRYGDVLADLAEYEKALAQLHRAEAESRQGDWPSLRVEALRHLASLVGRQGHYAEALAHAERAVLLAEAPEVDDLQRLQALVVLAETRFADRLPGVVEAARRAVAVGERHYGARIAGPLLSARQVLGAGLLLEGQPQQARPLLQGVVDERLQLLGPRHLALAAPLNMLANACIASGRPADALKAVEQLGEVVRANESPQSLTSAVVLFRRATVLEAGRHWDAAAHTYREALALLQAQPAPPGGFAAAWTGGLVHTLARAGLMDEVVARLPVVLNQPMQDAFDAAIRGRQLAVTQALSGAHEDALRHATTAEAAASSVSSPTTRAVALAQCAWVRLRSGAGHDAVEVLTDAERVLAERVDADSPDLAETRSILGRALLAVGQAERAVTLLQAAQKGWAAAGVPEAEQARTAAVLAQALLRLGRSGEAAEAAARAQAALAGSARADDRQDLAELHAAGLLNAPADPSALQTPHSPSPEGAPA